MTESNAPLQSLYERLGGAFAIAAVVDHFSTHSCTTRSSASNRIILRYASGTPIIWPGYHHMSEAHLHRYTADLPPSEWSKISMRDHEGVWRWAGGTSRRRLSARHAEIVLAQGGTMGNAHYLSIVRTSARL